MTVEKFTRPHMFVRQHLTNMLAENNKDPLTLNLTALAKELNISREETVTHLELIEDPCFDAVIKARKVDADTWVIADNEGAYLKARHGGK